tara:strand:+ start:34 stop:261 length:228 start_codon:yes stop_codon:yes gene_type:complete
MTKMEINMQEPVIELIAEDIENDDIEINKDMTKSERMGRSEAARAKRAQIKQVIETKVTHAWAKARKARKAKKAK